MKYIQIFILALLVSMITSCKDDTPANPQDSTNGNVNQPPKETTEETPVKPQNNQKPFAGVDFITEKDGKKYYKFRLKMKSNVTRTHEVYNVTRISHKISGVEKASNYVSIIELAETPIKTLEDQITMRIKYLSFEKAAESDGIKQIIVKTADKEQSYNIFQTKVYNAVIQEPVNIQMTSLAKIEKIEGSERIVTAVLKNILGDNMEENPEYNDAKTQFDKVFSEDELKQTFHEGYFKLPLKEISVDESWQDNIVLNIQYIGYVAFKINLMLKNVKKIDGKFIAKIELTGKFNEYSDDNKFADNIGITESNYLGSIDFNLTDGSFGNFIRKADLKVSEMGDNDQVTKFVFNCGKEEKIVKSDKKVEKKSKNGENETE